MRFAVIFAQLITTLSAAQTTRPSDRPTPATQPAAASDETMDWLLKQATTAPAGPAEPATQSATPTSRPASPFVDKPKAGEVAGTVELSDGTKLTGIVSTTAGKPLRLWDEQAKKYVDIPFQSIASMEAEVLWERDEPEWRFKESGSDEKLYTGKTYPARETQYTVKLVNGDQLTGGIVAPILVRTETETKQHVLHKRDKGDVGKTLKDLVYIRSITLAP